MPFVSIGMQQRALLWHRYSNNKPNGAPLLSPYPLRPYVEDFSPAWLAGNTCALTAGALALVYIADTITELKLGNGTSVCAEGCVWGEGRGWGSRVMDGTRCDFQWGGQVL